MAVYRPLISYLSRQESRTAVLSFAEIEKILERPLPDSATMYPAFWSKGNLYRLATTHEVVRGLFKVNHSVIDDSKEHLSIYPDQLALVMP